MRMGPGLPFVPSTQVSVRLAGWRQVLALGSTQVFVALPHVFETAVHALSVLATQVSWGRLHVLVALPVQV
jgi:hypothetical protein